MISMLCGREGQFTVQVGPNVHGLFLFIERNDQRAARTLKVRIRT